MQRAISGILARPHLQPDLVLLQLGAVEREGRQVDGLVARGKGQAVALLGRLVRRLAAQAERERLEAGVLLCKAAAGRVKD